MTPRMTQNRRNLILSGRGRVRWFPRGAEPRRIAFRRSKVTAFGMMNRAAPQMRRIAHRLMVHEAPRNGAAKVVASAFPVIDKLSIHLAMLVSNGGVRALVARALVLAADEITWLGAVQVNANGDLEGLETLGAGLDPETLLEGRVVLLAQLLGLLAAFIGPGLTSRLMNEIWPEIPLEERDFGEEHHHEKAE